MTSPNGNVFRVSGHLSGEFTGHWWIPLKKASEAELWCFLCFAPKRLSKRSRCRWFERPSGPIWRHNEVKGMAILLSGCTLSNLPFWIFQFNRTDVFCRNMHLDLILIVFTTKACCSISSGVEFIRGPPGISLYCIDIGDFTPRSVIECALRTSQMELYGNSFAYRNGKCYVCRADSENCNVSEDEYTWASCQIRKIAGAHAPGMPGTFSPSPQVSDPDMHHGTCVTHVPWCMPGSLTSGFIWNRRRGETFPAFPAHAQPAILRIW